MSNSNTSKNQSIAILIGNVTEETFKESEIDGVTLATGSEHGTTLLPPLVSENADSTLQYLAKENNTNNVAVQIDENYKRPTSDPNLMLATTQSGVADTVNSGHQKNDFTSEGSKAHNDKNIAIGCSVFAALSLIIALATAVYLKYVKRR